ncbi:MAG: DUF3422 domain-containing protein [Rhodobacteraceae bacterium]|nr:DUF3422 domain-containing protein [Paracoccaceae bacterium]
MTGKPIEDHPLRYALNSELHARPFPELTAPCRAAYLAIKQPSGAARRDRGLDRAHLLALLDRFGAAHPAPGATHHAVKLGRSFLKWEMHSEFVSYTLYADGVEERPFEGRAFNLFPADWLAEAPGVVISSVLIRMESEDFSTRPMAEISKKLGQWFVPESVTMSYVVDREAIVASDFRIDESGHVRFAIITNKGVSRRRLGRIAQRLLETETYMNASMLGFPVARKVIDETEGMEDELSGIYEHISQDKSKDSATLEELLGLAGRIENLASHTAFRFGATEAYARIVEQRIKLMREERFEGRQLISEFMMRRYEPAIRTCISANKRLEGLSKRTERAANLLRTRVDVENAQQNRLVLERMDQRAGLQLRLQETVEGLSVVAISYYAVSLLAYLLEPVAPSLGLEKYQLVAALTLPVVLLVWWLGKRVRKKLK